MKPSFNKTFHYLWQPCVATLYMWGILLLLGSISQSAILGSIGASALAATTLIVFASPTSPVAHFTRIIGGYSLGTLVGILCHVMMYYSSIAYPTIDILLLFKAFSAFSVGLSILLMSLLKMQHPPAVGLAFGLVIEPWDFSTLAIIFVGALLIAILKVLLEPFIKPLV